MAQRRKNILSLVLLLSLAVLAWCFISRQSYLSLKFGLYLSIVALDFYLVPGSMSCSSIRFASSPDKLSRSSFESEWVKIFEDPEVVAFRKNFLQTCLHRNKSLTLDIARRPRYCLFANGSTNLERSNTTIVRGMTNAFHSAINYALFANFSDRNFYLLTEDWNYGPWNKYFSEDNSSCPITRLPNHVDAYFTTSNSSYIGKFIPPASFSIDGPGNALYQQNCPLHGSPAFWETVENYDNWVDNGLGLAETYRLRSVIARALLVPNEEIKEKTKRLWSELTRSCGGYMAVHIRRTDKVATTESIELPLVFYFRALRRYCHLQAKPCARKIFVFCDNATVCQEFTTLASACFDVTDFWKEVSLLKLEPWYSSVPVAYRSQHHFDSLPEKDRVENGQEMLISLMLAAMADHVVCTFSSSVGRFIAHLRPGAPFGYEINGLDRLSVGAW